MTEPRPSTEPPSSRHWRQIFTLFGRMGFTAFGGPAAHVAMFESEIVERRRWVSRQHFLDLLGATQLIPGPNSTEMALHLGYERGRLPGMLAAAIGFIGPAAGLTLLFAWVYSRFGTLPEAQPVMRGVLPVALAVILAALWRLGKKAIRGWRLAVLAAAVAVAVLRGVPEVAALLGGGFLGMAWLRFSAPRGGSDGGGSRGEESEGGAGDGGEGEGADDPEEGGSELPGADGSDASEPGDDDPSSRGSRSARHALAGGAATLASAAPVLGTPGAAATAAGTAGAAALAGPTLWQIGLFFAKVGAVLYGSGYVLVAFLESDLVLRYGWLGEDQLLSAIAVGQLTPGPVLTTATFIGYLLAGVEGALLATLAIFLPSFVFVLLLNPIVPRLRRNRWTAAFLDAVNASALALMAVVSARLGAPVLVDPIPTVL
ncbi:MAG: chromate transporter, partial [Holophagales bacterium]|nr:chromate transporter [Holophagales bacterium]